MIFFSEKSTHWPFQNQRIYRISLTTEYSVCALLMTSYEPCVPGWPAEVRSHQGPHWRLSYASQICHPWGYTGWHSAALGETW